MSRISERNGIVPIGRAAVRVVVAAGAATLMYATLMVVNPASGLASNPCSTAPKAKTVAYRTGTGAAQNLTSLDLYMPSSACRKGKKVPVVMWVHGGGYTIGDKQNQVADKVKLFSSRAWAFASVNYRLSSSSAFNPWRWPTHFDDVAASVGWVRKNVSASGGDPARIALLGHSAGADIVSNVSVNPEYLQKFGQPLGAIRCSGPLDTEGFDKPSSTSPEKAAWENALGSNPDYLTATSATLLVKRNIGIPKTITVVRGSGNRQEIERAFAAKLIANGIPATVIQAQSLSHDEVNSRIGAAGDKVMTPPLLNFLTACLR